METILCFAYTIGITSCLGIAALLTERALPTHWPRRWIWFSAIALSMTIPPIYQARHVASVATGLGPLDAAWISSLPAHYSLIFRLWLLTSALLVVWGALNAWRVSRLTRARSAIIDGIPVVLTEAAGPAMVGVLRSRVVLPRWVLGLPQPQRRYVLRHEEEHRKAHDGRLLFVTSLSVLLAPWNLALWWQLRRLGLAIEVDCDNRVVAALGDAPAYGELLFKIAEAGSHGPRMQPGFLGEGMLERRLTLLLAPAGVSRFMRYALPAIAIAILFVVLSTPHPRLASVSTTPSHHEAQR